MQQVQKPFKENNTGLEEAWYRAIGGGTQIPGVWEDVVKFTPLNQWSPDTVFTTNGYGQTNQTTLAQYWMRNHNGAWKSFLENISKGFRDLKDSIVVFAAIEGMHTTYANRGRYEAAGSEEVVKNWLVSYEDKWVEKQDFKDALLNQAIEVDFLDLSDYLIEKGANPQSALRFVTTKKAYDLLLKAKADPFIKSDIDARDYAVELTTQRRNIFEQTYAKDTVYEELVSRADNAYASAKERESIINDMAKRRLKVKTGENAVPLDERREMLFDTIKNAKKKKEVITAVKACMPECWDWADIRNNGETVIHALTENGQLDTIIEAVRAKFPEEKLGAVDQNGQNIFFYAGKKSKEMTNWPYDSSTLETIFKYTKPQIQDALKLIEIKSEEESEEFPSCPARDSESAPMNFFDENGCFLGVDSSKAAGKIKILSNFWQIPAEDFWKAASQYNVEHKGFIENLAAKLVKSASGWKQYDHEAKSWQDAMSLSEGFFEDKALSGDWKNFACLLDIHNASIRVRGYWVNDDEKKKVENKVSDYIESWVEKGADVRRVFDLMKTNDSSYRFINGLSDRLVAVAERKMLKDRAEKTISSKQKNKDLFSGAL